MTAAVVAGPAGRAAPDPARHLSRRQRAARQAQLTAALHTVIDPELDQPITDLGFVADSRIEGTAVSVRLRLPTAFCSPNFAYLMVSDAHDAVSALPWVTAATVQLIDHHDADRINGGVAAGLGFTGTYPTEAAGELDALRRTFRVKAHTAFIERVCTTMVREHGWRAADLGGLRIGDLPAGRSRDGLCRRRADLGLPCRDADPVLVDDAGAAWAPADVSIRLRFARAVRISIDGNAHFCRGLLQTRYGEPDQSPVGRAGTTGTLADLGLPASRRRMMPAGTG